MKTKFIVALFALIDFRSERIFLSENKGGQEDR